MKKSFFFVRNKIDVDVKAEKQKRAFKEDVTLSNIRKDALEKLKDLVANDEEVFLISSHKPKKWDFARLTEAILDSLPLRQKETLTLSLHLQTTQSKDILKRKADVLRGGYTTQYIFFVIFLANLIYIYVRSIFGTVRLKQAPVIFLSACASTTYLQGPSTDKICTGACMYYPCQDIISEVRFFLPRI